MGGILMIDLKVEIEISFRQIQTGKIIHSEKFLPFDICDEKELRERIAMIYKNLKEIQIANKLQEEEENGE